MPGRILTIDEYALAIDRNHHAVMEALRARQSAMSKRIFKSWALRRFEEHAPVYGPCDLTLRNWIQQQSEELVDAPAYGHFELVTKERGLMWSV